MADQRTPSAPYEVDPERGAALVGTGIFIRAKTVEGYESVDIYALTKDSLLRRLRSRGGDNPWAEQTVCMLLGHGP